MVSAKELSARAEQIRDYLIASPGLINCELSRPGEAKPLFPVDDDRAEVNNVRVELRSSSSDTCLSSFCVVHPGQRELIIFTFGVNEIITSKFVPRIVLVVALVL